MWKCKRCGSLNEGEVCIYCNAPKDEKPEIPQNRILLIVCIALAVVLCGIAAFIMFNILGDKPAVVNREDDNISLVEESESEESDVEIDKEENVSEISVEEIERIITSNSAYTDFNVYVKNLSNGYEFGYRENTEVLASAMAQIVILDTVAEMHKDGVADVDTNEQYFSYIPNGKQAPESPNQDGMELSIRTYIEDVATYGDNNKSNALVDFIGYTYGENGFDVINERLDRKGFRNTRINRKTFTDPSRVDNTVSANSTCAYDIGNIFENLVTSGNLGSSAYVTKLFRSIDASGNAIGLKAHVPLGYTCANVNALNDRTTNNVAFISDGDAEIVVVILSNTFEDMVSKETNAVRDGVHGLLLEYIMDTQFDN